MTACAQGENVDEVIELKRQGLGIRAISRLTGYDRKTISREALVQIASFPSDTVLIWGAGYGDEEWEGYEGIVCGSAFRS
jgi:hypothetical protein